MKEADVRRSLISNLKAFGHIEAIENIVGTGNPDVNYCFNSSEGWIEVKFRRDIPTRPSTPLFGKCLKPTQHIWFRKRYACGHKRLFLYGRAGNEFYLIPGRYHYEFETMTRNEFIDTCLWSGLTGSCDWDELCQVLKNSYPKLPSYL